MLCHVISLWFLLIVNTQFLIQTACLAGANVLKNEALNRSSVLYIQLTAPTINIHVCRIGFCMLIMPRAIGVSVVAS